ncbi:alkaline phosphatase, partial [Haoranjiania flava]
LSRNKNGFVMQIEGGKVDWAAHANDAAALLYDQIAFDDALKVAMDFVKNNKDTLLIVTTDHGNANPGLFYGSKAGDNFDKLQSVKHSSDWILMGITKDNTAAQVRERIEAAHGIAVSTEEAGELLKRYQKLDSEGIYNSYKLPFRELAMMEQKYFNIGFGSMDHSGDYVELTMSGPGSENLLPFVKNYELHNFLLKAAGVMA